jgi:carbon storage regulator
MLEVVVCFSQPKGERPRQSETFSHGGMIMLVLCRKVGEQICVPELDMVLTVLEVSGSRVRFGISAPEKVAVVRKELRDRSPQHNADATVPGTDSETSRSADEML